MTDIIVICPHCQQYVFIQKLNCGIFILLVPKPNSNILKFSYLLGKNNL